MKKKIKNAIHLDLLNLITKFYSNNENIIYIPKDIEIYIKINNYLKIIFITI
jgi:ethanolamine utilization protein EutQ (cupin superfamily)